ncbi:MAG TPA: hypothetical protein VGM27_11780 [Acidobacteriaceae bacterium]
MSYVVMCFGWLQELLEEERVPDFSAALQTLSVMMDRGGMIVHAYRETDQEHPELVGRHHRLQSVHTSPTVNDHSELEPGHEIERFLLDAASFRTWADALKRNVALEQLWRVIDLWPVEEGECECLYGRATLIEGARIRQNPVRSCVSDGRDAADVRHPRQNATGQFSSNEEESCSF